MKKLLTRMLRMVPLLAMVLIFLQTNAQRPYGPLAETDFQITMKNIVQPSGTTNILEFDIYIKDTDPSQDLPMATAQFGLYFNLGILNGAATTTGMTIALPYSEGFSDLPSSMAPNGASTLATGLIRIAGRAAPGCADGFVISKVGSGTRVNRFRFTSPVSFVSGSTPDFIFTANTATNPSYATRFAWYNPACTNVQLPVVPGVNALVLENPILNFGPPCTYPIIFNVTGGGSYCEGGIGVPVGLSGSQVGVNYTLNPGAVVIAGDGNPISFGNIVEPAAYTVTALSDGTNPYICNEPLDMLGSADVIVTPLEFSEVLIEADPPGPVCSNTIVTFTATPVNGGITPLYEWFINNISQNTPSSDNTFSTAMPDGDQVFVIMTPDFTCSAGSVQSVIYTFEVNPTLPVSVSIEADQNDVCAGTEVTFTATPVNGGSEPQYTWYVNGIGTPGNYYFTYVPANGDVVYVELLADVTQMCLTGNPATSSSILMNVNPELEPSVIFSADPAGPVNTGTMVEFTAAGVNGGDPAFEWFVNDISVGTGNPFSYIPINGDQVYVVMTSTETCITTPIAVSDVMVMVVNDILLPPLAFNVTGGGSYCSGTGGVPVGLDGSEVGVSYVITGGQPIIGTGGPLTFPNQIIDGTYHIWGTNAAGTTEMNGVAYVVAISLPVIDFAPLAGVCVGSGDVTLSAIPAGGTFSGDGVTGNVFTPSVAGTFDITYNYTDPSTGCVAVPVTQSITVNPSTDPAGPISGPAIVTEGDMGVAYSIAPISGAVYNWYYGGTGVTINGSDAAVTLDFADGATSGILTVYGVTGCGAGGASFLDITVEPLVVPCPDFSTWNGSVSEDWFDAANWTPMALPCETTNVTIPSGSPNQPTINTPLNNTAACLVTISALTIHDGGSLIGQQYLCVLNDAVVERTIVNSNFHLISSPVDAVTFGDVFLPAYWFEVWAREYNEPSGDWMNQFITDHLAVGSGYSVQMTTAPQTATFTGMLNGYDVTRTLSNMNPGTDLNRIGWNLLGNPFPSAIDWDDFSVGDYDAQVAVWDEAGAGNYIYWNGTVGSLTEGIIPAQQGFFVKTATNGAALTIPMSAQVHSAQSFYKETIANALELRANGNNYYDATFVHFNSNATADFDNQYDAFKLEGLETAPQLYNMAAGYNLSINELPFEGNEVVNLGFKCGVAGTYSLNASGLESFSSSTPILLEDLKLNVIQDLRLNPVYSFNYATNDSEARFKLHFKAATGIADPTNSGIFVYSYEHTVVINNTTNLNGEIRIFDMTGRELKDASMSATSATRLPLQVAVGTYIVKVTTAQGTVNQKVYVK